MDWNCTYSTGLPCDEYAKGGRGIGETLAGLLAVFGLPGLLLYKIEIIRTDTARKFYNIL
jgi:hypothetical protein